MEVAVGRDGEGQAEFLPGLPEGGAHGATGTALGLAGTLVVGHGSVAFGSVAQIVTSGSRGGCAMTLTWIGSERALAPRLSVALARSTDPPAGTLLHTRQKGFAGPAQSGQRFVRMPRLWSPARNSTVAT